MMDLHALIDFLGPAGAIAGLEKSDLTVADLQEFATGLNLANSAKMKRAELIAALVSKVREESTKSTVELMEMDAEALKDYFHQAKLSKTELLQLLMTLDIRPSSAARKSLAEFAAQEISDIGMFRRVAKGRNSS